MNPVKKIMVLGGYGIFGSRIVSQLCQMDCIIVIAGRNQQKASKLSNKLREQFPQCQLEIAIFDVHKELAPVIKQHQPTLIIHTCGPFQGQAADIARTCIQQSVHYIDLADGRDFIKVIAKHNDIAKKNNIIAITAASTVPTLSAAVLEHHFNPSAFSKFTLVKYGVTPGQKTDRGLATTKAVLSYIGKPIKPSRGETQVKYGWQDLYMQNYPEIGNRLMGNCEVPDLDLLQHHFPIEKLHFSAGMESKTLHIIIWLLSWLVRLKLPLNLAKHAKTLLKLGRMFDFLGGDDGGMHVQMQGYDKQGKALNKTWYIIAKQGDGPMIPTIPAIIMAKKIISKEFTKSGVQPCIGIISLEEYLQELADFDVKVY